jgi:epoxide hydrolase-like predicted phosphatase
VFKAVIFDVAGVLTESIGQVLLEAAIGIDGDIEKLAEALIPVFMGEGDTDSAGHQLERGEITLNYFLSSLGPVEKDAWTILHPDSDDFFGDNLQPKPEMHNFVAELKKAGLKTGIVSNNVKEWQKAWDAVIPSNELFHTTIFSSEVGHRKPNPEIFRIALEKLDVSPEETIFLDDFPAMAEGARAVGIQAIYVEDHEQAIAQTRDLLQI